MDQKLQQLTEKLYNEGVAKGNQEAEKIVTNAKAVADKIINTANSEAQSIIDNAQKKAADMEKNTKSELQLAAGQMLESLKQEVSSIVNGEINSIEIKKAFQSKEFIQQLILNAVSNWAPKQDLLVIVSPHDEKELKEYFAQKAAHLLNDGLKIETANNVKAGFQIGPADGRFKVSFTETDFVEFFKAFLRPKVVELLFKEG